MLVNVLTNMNEQWTIHLLQYLQLYLQLLILIMN